MPLQIIGEIGSTHDGSIGNAVKLIEHAAATGFTAVKFQHHIFEHESLDDALQPGYFKSESRKDYFNRIQFHRDDWVLIKKCCEQNQVQLIVSPFSIQALHELLSLRISSIKIASGEINNYLLLAEAAKQSERLYISTGMSDPAEIHCSINQLAELRDELAVFQCTSEYPCRPENVGLDFMRRLNKYSDLFSSYSVGLSDHTLGAVASILAINSGATVIEKHICFSNLMYGSDALHSLEAKDMKQFVDSLKEAQIISRANTNKTITEGLQHMRSIFMKKPIALKDLHVGDIIDSKNFALLKTGQQVDYEFPVEDPTGRVVVAEIKKSSIIPSHSLKP